MIRDGVSEPPHCRADLTNAEIGSVGLFNQLVGPDQDGRREG
jgi:hypothetical protein